MAGGRWQVAPPEEPVCHQPVVEELELEGVGLAPSGQVVVELGWVGGVLDRLVVEVRLVMEGKERRWWRGKGKRKNDAL